MVHAHRVNLPTRRRTVRASGDRLAVRRGTRLGASKSPSRTAVGRETTRCWGDTKSAGRGHDCCWLPGRHNEPAATRSIEERVRSEIDRALQRNIKGLGYLSSGDPASWSVPRV